MIHFVITDKSVYVYSVMLVFSVFAGFLFSCILLKIRKVCLEYIIYSVMLNLILMLSGAALFTILANPSVLKNIAFPYIIPLSSAGAGIGMFVGTLLIAFIIPAARKEFMNCYALSIPFIYALSKIGCFFAGCCEGIPYEGVFAVDYTLKSNHDGIRFPVQLAETIVFLGIFIVCFALYIYKNTKYLFLILMSLCAIGKFSLDFLRNAHVGKLFSINQIVCVVFLFIALIWFFMLYYKRYTDNNHILKEEI